MTAAEEAGSDAGGLRTHEPLTQCLLLAAAVDGVREMLGRSGLASSHPGIGIAEAAHHLDLAAAYVATALQLGEF